MRLIFKTSSVTPDFFYVFNLILSFSTCSESFEKICSWELLGANVLKNGAYNCQSRARWEGLNTLCFWASPLKQQHYAYNHARLILVIFYVLFHPCRQKGTSVRQQQMMYKVLKMSYFNETFIGIKKLSDHFLAGTEIESSNQAFEYVKFLLKALESENFSLRQWNY